MQKGEIRNPVTVVLLTIVTCGIYGIIWFLAVCEDVNKGLGRKEFNAGKELVLSIVTCGLWGYWFVWRLSEATVEVQRSWGVEPKMAAPIVFLTFFSGLGAFFVQTGLNNAWENGTAGTPAESQRTPPKELQEIPVRTQELPLDPAPYLERFNAMVEELRANPKIEVLEYTVNPPATDAEIAQAEEYAAVPDVLKQFYRQCNGLKLEWALTADENRGPRGNINIMKVQQTFSSWEGVIWFDEEWDDGAYKPLHPLDFFVDEACAALYLDDTPGQVGTAVYYHYCGEQMDSLRVNFEGYLELLLKSRGYWYWQEAIVSDLTGREFTTSAREFRQGMPEIFDDYDPAFFLRKDYAGID